MTTAFQQSVYAWVKKNYPHMTSPHWRATKLAEEVGEVQGAIVKMEDGSGRKTKADLEQECAQAAICLYGLAEAAGFDLDVAVVDEYRRVIVANPNRVEPISDANLAAMRTGHHVSPHAKLVQGKWCFECQHDWPCPTTRLIARLDAADAELEAMTTYAECLARGLSDSEARGTAWPDG